MKPDILAFLFALLLTAYAQNITLQTTTSTTQIATNNQINQQFYQSHAEMDCGMPQLFIMPDHNHQTYKIQTSQVNILQIVGKWQEVRSSISCQSGNCQATINNLCNVDSQNHQINWIQVQTSIGMVEYLVNCDPNTFYKPIQWGLLLIIAFSAVTVTISALYSRAWSYGNYGFQIGINTIVVFNVLLLTGITLAYLAPQLFSVGAKIFGSIIGALGVMVCANQTIWLTKSKRLRQKLWRFVRRIDFISFLIGLAFIPLYWSTNGNWFVNDIMAVCSIVALMKLLKIKSLSVGVVLLSSLLIVEIAVGLFIHYVVQVSYNSYIINLFQNPIILLYRRCAWLPITSILFPGILISYLRRFDLTRRTQVYFVIGILSFYIGSLIWMFLDLYNIHSLPFAIISEPVTIFILFTQSVRRNEFQTLWRGNFHDQQLQSTGQIFLSKQTQIIAGAPSEYTDLTATLHLRSSQFSVTNDAARWTNDQL